MIESILVAIVAMIGYTLPWLVFVLAMGAWNYLSNKIRGFHGKHRRQP